MFSISAVLKKLVEEFAPNFGIEEQLSDAELECFFSIKGFLETKAGWCGMLPGELEDSRGGESATEEELVEVELGRSGRIPIEERRSSNQLRKMYTSYQEQRNLGKTGSCDA